MLTSSLMLVKLIERGVAREGRETATETNRSTYDINHICVGMYTVQHMGVHICGVVITSLPHMLPLKAINLRTSIGVRV